MMANPAAATLRIAIGDYPHTLPLKRGEIVVALVEARIR